MYTLWWFFACFDFGSILYWTACFANILVNKYRFNMFLCLLVCWTGSDCRTVSAVSNNNVRHVYDIHVANGILYYTDWNTSAVNVLSLADGGAPLQPIASGLVRPSQFIFVTTPTTKGFKSTRMIYRLPCSDVSHRQKRSNRHRGRNRLSNYYSEDSPP